MNTSEPARLEGIFLLFEGLPPTILESQVLTHVRVMAQEGIEMEVWAFATNQTMYSNGSKALPRLLRDHGVGIRLFRGVRPGFPFSRQLNALLLLGQLKWRRKRPLFIHARTDYAASVAATVKKFGRYRLIWDARGDTLGEREESLAHRKGLSRWWAKIKSQAFKSGLMQVAKACDGAIFVSEALRSLQGSSIDVNRTIVVPCLADESIFYYDPVLRREARRELGYNDDHRVMLYSGSAAPWQCVQETVDRMVDEMARNSRCRSLIVTSEPQVFKDLVPTAMKDRFIICSATLKEMNRFLNAADVAIMLRSPGRISWVASPVKFAEYCLTGLQVVTNGTIEQSAALTQNIENILATYATKVASDFDKRMYIAKNSSRLLGRSYHKSILKKFYMRTCAKN
jgi:hypothetical protein